MARACYLSRCINQVVRIYHPSADGLSRGAVSVRNNAQGLYLLAWDILEHHMDWFRYRPKEFLMAAARYPRFQLALGYSGVPTAGRKSVVEGKSGSVRVDLGGRRIIQKKKNHSQ